MARMILGGALCTIVIAVAACRRSDPPAPGSKGTLRVEVEGAEALRKCLEEQLQELDCCKEFPARYPDAGRYSRYTLDPDEQADIVLKVAGKLSKPFEFSLQTFDAASGRSLSNGGWSTDRQTCARAMESICRFANK